MTTRQFIRENREDIDAVIAHRMGCSIEELPHRNDDERRQWLANDEGLYLWARSAGAPV